MKILLLILILTSITSYSKETFMPPFVQSELGRIFHDIELGKSADAFYTAVLKKDTASIKSHLVSGQDNNSTASRLLEKMHLIPNPELYVLNGVRISKGKSGDGILVSFVGVFLDKKKHGAAVSTNLWSKENGEWKVRIIEFDSNALLLAPTH